LVTAENLEIARSENAVWLKCATVHDHEGKARTRSAAVTAVHVAVRDALADLGDGDLVLVACSGGPDSLTLAAATANLARQHGWRAGAVVIDHGWSAAASAAGVVAAAACRSLGLDPVELVEVDAKGAGGREAAARTARYDALQKAAEEQAASTVLLGHTLDDQAETVLLGLGRGSGARSLAGMVARRGIYRRPLLRLPRSVVHRACAELELEPWSDPANDDPAYTRVRVRRLAGELERALGPGAAAALARTADLLRDDADALDAVAADLFARSLRSQQPGNYELDLTVLGGAHPAIRRRVLLAAARTAGSPAGALSHRHAVAMDGLLAARPGSSTDLPGAVTVRLVTTDGMRRLNLRHVPGRLGDMGGLRASSEPAPAALTHQAGQSS
jgi:tRNA(Ile)-lysidine synthase